jgi:uncharacterized protein (TIGR03492 family)
MPILCLSNGHGEDIIAVRILEQLQKFSPREEVFALPIVGQGYAYQFAGIPILGNVKQMPSGGFIYMDTRQLWGDLKGGLLGLTLNQYQVTREFAKKGGYILAVGDLVPLLFAWLSGANYAFVGTAKSEYYIRDESGWLERTDTFERLLGGVYLPWERSLMLSKRCDVVFPRDQLTTDVLQGFGINAHNLGNPMMDGLQPDISDKSKLNILLLPGSRVPEALGNWQLILTAVEAIVRAFKDREITFIAALSTSLDREPFEKCLLNYHWNAQVDSQYELESAKLLLPVNSFAHCLAVSNAAIAMAGTATEQFVGLGKPVITFPGAGPQFTYAFAEAQTRLLGCSVSMVNGPNEVPSVLEKLLNNPTLLAKISANGKDRLGDSGAAARIANFILKDWT